MKRTVPEPGGPQAARLRRAVWIGVVAMLVVAGALATHRAPAAAVAPSVTMAARANAPHGVKRAAKRRAPAPSQAQVLEMAKNARLLEEDGAYGGAASMLRRLRTVTPRDADLDLELALDLARIGRADSAAALLWSPLLTRALDDTLPIERRHLYPWERESLWLDGAFDGWSWYVARARAEVAASLGRWHEARVAAEACIASRPMAGQEWLVYAVCAGREGLLEEARAAAHFAAQLDPTLPEAAYLAGLHEWRAGHAQQAQRHFRAAVMLDSTWSVPALALIRSRLAGAAPDSLPVEFLTGLRAAGLLTSPVRPKVEEFVQMDESAIILRRGTPNLPDSVMTHVPDIDLALPVLVDERGRAALTLLPWLPPSQLPPAVVSGIVGSLNDWRFQPATRNGAPHPVWATVEYAYKPAASMGGSGNPRH